MHPCSQTLPVINGQLQLPGDKSISHRALMFNALSGGMAQIKGLSHGQDVQSTRHCLETLGCIFTETEEALLINAQGFMQQDKALELDCGNSGTTARLLCGLLAGTSTKLTLVGDESLSKRPMKRITAPLSEIGLSFETSDNRLPLSFLAPNQTIKGITYTLPMASAQVKSAVLLAGLWCPPSETVAIVEPLPSRDHTERMLNAMGCRIEKEGRTLTLIGRRQDINASDISVPGDISSAAFLMVAAAILPGSTLTLQGVSLNPSRTPLLALLEGIGVSVTSTTTSESVGEPLGTVSIKSPERLTGDISLNAEDIPLLIDEIPILTILGLFNDGTLTIRGAEELRHKESDRLQAMIEIVKACGVDITEAADGFSIKGDANFQLPKAIYEQVFETHHDHRLVMSLEILQLRAQQPLQILGKEWVKISYPSFYEHLNRLLQKV